MKYVVVKPRDGAFWHDPSAYIDALPAFVASLPPGAKAFATDPDHYDFYGERCVKDLWFDSLVVSDEMGVATLRFSPNKFKHSAGLVLTYSGVHSVESTAKTGDSLRLDEILPAPEGTSHEFQLIGGTIRIVAADFNHVWQ